MDIIAAIKANESDQEIFKKINESKNLNVVESQSKDSALRVALIYRRKNVVVELINKKIDVNIQNKQGDTALGYLCSIWPEEDLIDLLLEKKANVDLGGITGWTPLLAAINYSDDISIIKLLNKSNLNDIEKKTLYREDSLIDLVYKYKAINVINHLKLLCRNSMLESIDCDNTIINKCFKNPICDLNTVDIIIDLVY